MNSDDLLTNLNASQRAAVSSFADTLAILAGPGSGKTHTLTSRTAWLLSQGLKPWNIIVATFTVKAAREMKERIGRLIGDGLESKLILGTFHSIARRYLARYGHLINIRKDFGIADSADSLAILKRITKRHKFAIDPKVARSRISSMKAKGIDKLEVAKKKSVETQEFETCYNEYQAALERSNLLDYDDLLLQCVELLRLHPSCVSNVEAVLIDEFQDTNRVQFDLMRLFAAERKRITIVGDPDQSIYGFRAAEIKNYKRMIHQYPDTITIPLEENYRSSGAILLTALSVIEQDDARIAKSLMPTHTIGTRPVLRRLAGAQLEADWIVSEIQRCMGLTGDLLDLNDFAILLRSAALSRLIESSLGRAGIAYRMVGGLKFYDRVEVKTVLDYMRVINQPDNNDALARIINTPSRRIGESSIKALLEEADLSKITLWSLILGIVQGEKTTKTKLPKQTDQNLSIFVNIILTARNNITCLSTGKRFCIVELIDFVLKKTSYEKWLEEHYNDVHKARWANVQELITQASDFEAQIGSGYEDEFLPEIDGLEQEDESDPLSRFLANVALASEVRKGDDGETTTAQVTISTIHAAKGLEWPVVFIPATYQGSIPHSRAEDKDEERRLLYVAMTRAKALLYMSCPLRNSQGEETTLSPFLSFPSLAPLLDKSGPSLRPDTIQSISLILRRSQPSQESITRSASYLQFLEDTQFPIEDGEAGGAAECGWGLEEDNITIEEGQRAPKRQRIGPKTSAGSASVPFKAGYSTTMQRATKFTLQSVAMTTGFVSAGSHYSQLSQESSVAEGRVFNQGTLKAKEVVKKNTDRPQGQGTLLGFVGIAEAPTNAASQRRFDSENSSGITLRSSTQFTVNQMKTGTRPPLDNNPMGISPSLSNHRLGTAKRLNRPRPPVSIDDQQRQNIYSCFSSSPPKARATTPPELEPKPPPPGLKAKPAILSLVRPATTMHRTSISVAQGLNGAKRTLGVKRSMSSWSSGKNQPFVSPTIRRPE